MQFLIDTNCWMALVRNREHALDVRDLLLNVPASSIFITDYAAHTLIILLRRHQLLDGLEAFIATSGIGSKVALIDISPSGFGRIVWAINTLGLDVDDAYQHVAAELFGLKLVSLDTYFDKTPNGRLTPAAALKLFNEALEKKPAE